MYEGMTPQELFDIIKEYNEFDEESVIGCAVELLCEIKNNPTKFCNKLEDIIEEYADTSNKCPLCGAEIKSNITYEELEYLGTPCKQENYERECPNCGIID